MDKDKYDNLCIAIKSLVQELVKPVELNEYHKHIGETKTRSILDAYRAICVADDEDIRSKLLWLAGIEVHSTGTFGKDECLVWTEDVQKFDDGLSGMDMSRIYETIDHDDVDACEQAAFQNWLDEVGVLVE